MALSLQYNKPFLKQAEQVYAFLAENWSIDDAEKFVVKLNAKIRAIQKNPGIGALSIVKHVRTISVTAHNRLFYRVWPDRIAFLYLKDTRRRRYKR